MDDQISRTILDNFDVAHVENGQNEITKINAPSVLRGIESGALHFITVPNREQEFIDHVTSNQNKKHLPCNQNAPFALQSFLSPEYIATHIANGFIIDLMNNQDGSDQNQQPHFINEGISNDLEFQTDDHERKLTATFLQIVNKQCPTIKNENETQVIVTNKDLGAFTQTNETAKQNSIDHNFLTIDETQPFPPTLLNDSQLTHINGNPPLPPLTPIRRLNSPRKISSVNNQAAMKNDFNTESINNFKNDSEAAVVEDVRLQRPLTKRSLPHKKRITKKLRTIDLDPQPSERRLLFADEPEDTVEEESIIECLKSSAVLNTPQFSCQLCGHVCESQLDFFAHLKEHYEPTSTEGKTQSAVLPSEDVKKESLLEQGLPEVVITFENFDDDILQPVKDEVKIPIQADSSSSDPTVKDVEINVAEVEFSDTEDMLEGIRGVVDKVQESVDNDSNDGIDIISEKNWYTNSALNGDIHFKTGVAVNNHLNQQSVDNFSLFFKNDLPKSEQSEDQSAILPALEPVEISDHGDQDMDLDQCASPPESNSQEFTKSTRKHRKAKVRKEDLKDLSENWDSSDSEDKSKPKKRIQCPKCNKLFNSANALKYHDLSHTGERPHQCEVCGKSFFALSALKVHMRLHSGVKPYQCEFCKRAFRQWGDLKYHTISIHTNEKNFQCEFCGKAFARRYSLVVHRRIHTSERNYKCEFCPKSFRASSYLQNHRKVHTGEKPYACKVCGKKFRVSGDLKRHTNIHNRDKRKAKLPTAATAAEESSKSAERKGTAGLPVSSVKSEPSVVDLNSRENKQEVAGLDNRSGGLTIFYQDESFDIFKTEPTF